MAEGNETVTIGVDAGVQAFAAEVAAMRASLEDGLGASAQRAGSAIEAALLRAVRTGKFGFDDLKRVALAAMSEIAREALKAGLGALGSGASGGLLSFATSALTALIGLPGRASGGPVTQGRAYLVGERGPELFVPGATGRIVAGGGGPGGRDIRISVQVNAGAGTDPARLAASGRQIAQAVRRAIAASEG